MTGGAGDITSVLVLSDTHLSDPGRLPSAVFELAEQADHIIHAGDHSTLDLVHVLARFAPVTAVHGNVDAPDVYAQLPEQGIVSVGPMTIGVRHIAGDAHGRHERLAAWMPGCDVRVYGHTHAPEVALLADGTWVMNPGSPTQRRRAPFHSVGWVCAKSGVITAEIVQIDHGQVR